MKPFEIGESVELNSLLGELHGAALGTVVSMVRNEQGIAALDEYEIEFEDSSRLWFCRFQLTHTVVTQDRENENATVCY